jgi:CelD/BcsL family acetyltransferase involved in cellulose biosynthesis
MDGLTYSVAADVAALEALRAEWLDLLDRCETREATLSPPWILAWWSVFGQGSATTLRVVAFRDGARLAGLAPLYRRLVWYEPGIPYRSLWLLASGEDEHEEIASNYLGILAEGGAEEAVAETLADALVEGGLGEFDDLVLTRMDGSARLPGLLADACCRRRLHCLLRETGQVAFIALPDSWESYLASLPSKDRRNLLRILRLFDAWSAGDVRFEHATTGERTEGGLAILEKLHTERWSAEGKPGAFGSPRWKMFHERVLPELAALSAVDLSWLVVHSEPIAACYCLAWRGKVRAYQTGRRVNLPTGVSPGIVLHAHLIRRAIEARDLEYDLGGVGVPQRYKQELAPCRRSLIELRISRAPVRDGIRKGMRKLWSLAKRSAGTT